MTRIIPMPSPRGTNHEGLFILQGKRRIAYDQAPPNARREEQSAQQRMGSEEPQAMRGGVIDDETVNALCDWIYENMQPEQMAEVARNIAAHLHEGGDGYYGRAHDQPASFPGQPMIGGKLRPNSTPQSVSTVKTGVRIAQQSAGKTSGFAGGKYMGGDSSAEHERGFEYGRKYAKALKGIKRQQKKALKKATSDKARDKRVPSLATLEQKAARVSSVPVPTSNNARPGAHIKLI